jgi:8-oxo-dGTP diphosphatase
MKRFNVRIYGIVRNDRNELLVSHEQHEGMCFTKFPGGGLEWGEGSIECLKREFLEEFSLKIEVGKLIYFTDFFQVSAFSKNDQVLSVYYEVIVSTEALDTCILQDSSEEKLEWIPFQKTSENLLTFPIDKVVLKILQRDYFV